MYEPSGGSAPDIAGGGNEPWEKLEGRILAWIFELCFDNPSNFFLCFLNIGGDSEHLGRDWKLYSRVTIMLKKFWYSLTCNRFGHHIGITAFAMQQLDPTKLSHWQEKASLIRSRRSWVVLWCSGEKGWLVWFSCSWRRDACLDSNLYGKHEWSNYHDSGLDGTSLVEKKYVQMSS